MWTNQWTPDHGRKISEAFGRQISQLDGTDNGVVCFPPDVNFDTLRRQINEQFSKQIKQSEYPPMDSWPITKPGYTISIYKALSAIYPCR